MSGLPSPQRTVVAVATTSTVVTSRDVRSVEWMTLQVDNLDATQTFVGQIERRQSEEMSWSVSTIGDFAEIPASGSVTADLDVVGTGFIRLVGTMSGAGGDVAIAARLGVRK